MEARRVKARDRKMVPRARQHQQQLQHKDPLKCPRCESSATKFCYYNNYSLSQPRYFCKTCRRYWTQGGTLREIPIGGGCRKEKSSKKSSSSSSSSSSSAFSLSSASASSLTEQHSYSASIEAIDRTNMGVFQTPMMVPSNQQLSPTLHQQLQHQQSQCFHMGIDEFCQRLFPMPVQQSNCNVSNGFSHHQQWEQLQENAHIPIATNGGNWSGNGGAKSSYSTNLLDPLGFGFGSFSSSSSPSFM